MTPTSKTLSISEPDDLERSIAARIDEMCTRLETRKWKRSEWTKQTKNELASMGIDWGFKAYASTCDTATAGAWLFDLCWINYVEPILKAMPLAQNLNLIPKHLLRLRIFKN